MRKVLMAFSFAAISFVSANAQDNSGFHLSGGVKVGFPVQTSVNSLAIGAEFQGEYGFSENLTGVVSAGYMHSLVKSEFSSIAEASGMIPVMAGVRFYPSTNVFVGAKAGVGISTATGGGSAFAYEPHVGYNAEKFQAYAFYQGYGTAGSIGMIGATFLYKFN